MQPLECVPVTLMEMEGRKSTSSTLMEHIGANHLTETSSSSGEMDVMLICLATLSTLRSRASSSPDAQWPVWTEREQENILSLWPHTQMVSMACFDGRQIIMCI